MYTKTTRPISWLIWILVLVMATVPGASGWSPAAAQTEAGTIAYVVGNDSAGGDQIWLVEPNGSNNRQIYATGVEGAVGIQDISGLTWSPTGQEIAFTSRHEAVCSFYETDIYAVRPDGSGYRRVTAPPGCDQRAGMPTGTVNVVVQNNTFNSINAILYFQGALSPQFLLLAPFASTTITFDEVVDYGDQLQWAVAMFGFERYHSITANANVVAGGTVTTGTLSIDIPFYQWGWRWPTYRADGSRIAYLLSASGSFFAIPANQNIPGDIGEELTNPPLDDRPGAPEHLSYAPTLDRANQLLYVAYDFAGEGSTIYLVEEGANNSGQIILAVGAGVGNSVLGLDWLPNGSGFVYSVTEEFGNLANIFLYRFADQSNTRLTNFNDGFTRLLSVSPDGSRLVMERQTAGEWWESDPPIDLWMVNIDGSQPALFLENARTPAWGIMAEIQPPPPPAGVMRVYLPLLIR